MTQQSDWMKGLLWAEEYLQKGVFFEDDHTGVKSLYWELYYSGEFSVPEDFTPNSFGQGAADYLEYYKENLL